jgi:L-alanine-DL-glutamate epimerase-like enolase superfamily enzyme
MYLPLKTTFRQASSTRKTGESVWALANRGNHEGFGEGCPRLYVTGETVDTCLAWLARLLPSIEQECQTYPQLTSWVAAHASEIDEHPAAWCAVETALLDLFAREQSRSVESLVGREEPLARYAYTAILGDSAEDSFAALLDRYLAGGFSDFKVKLNGELQKDQRKLTVLAEKCEQFDMSNWRIRLDANNLWKAKPDVAIEHLGALDVPFFAIEEPVEPRNVAALSDISMALGIPVILDESLCNQDDLKRFDGVPGKFVANIKVSRVGGVLRALKLVEKLQELGWQIIVGAHVGETSIMTRAGMCIARAASTSLTAQEGGYGEILLQSEPAEPSLMFGQKGMLDLTRPYPVKTKDGHREVPREIWKKGWGLKCRLPDQSYSDPNGSRSGIRVREGMRRNPESRS